MNIEMKNFQPFRLLNHGVNDRVSPAHNNRVNTQSLIDKNNAANNILTNKLYGAVGIVANEQPEQGNFETVKENILTFVKTGLTEAKNSGASPEKLASLLSDAQRGITEGVASASEILQKSGLLSDNIKQGIDEAENFLSNALDKLSQEMFSDKTITKLPFSSYSDASHYNLTQDATFSFKTKEGDEVNITFNSDYLQQDVAVLNQTDQGTNSLYSQKISAQSAFSLEVNGDLNEQEQKAINELMGNLQNVSDLFFEGNLEEAFEQAKSISMDPTHLAAFSMDLQRTETVVSIKEYQQLMPGKEIAMQFTPVNDALASAFEQAKPFSIEEHLSSLLGWLMPEDQDLNDALAYSNAILNKLKSDAEMNA